MNFRHLLNTVLVAVLTLCARAEQVVFSEIMYQPPQGKPEYVEVLNLTVTPLDTALWTFSNGISYTFPDFNAGTPQAHILQPYERIIVSAATEAATRTAYPTIPANVRILGPWNPTSALSNDGERVTLQDKNGVIVCTVSYGDDGRWPMHADGPGHSLVLANENKTIDDWRVWRASTQNGGSPGQADPAPFATGIALNEIHFGATGRVDWIEVRNNGNLTLTTTGLFVSATNTFTDKVALSGNLTQGAVASVNVDFPTNGSGEIKLYLVDANNHIRDSVKLTYKPGREAWQKFPAGTGEWFNDPAHTRDAQNNPERNTDIVINEIMADPPSNQRDGEFLELHNRGAAPVNIGGWRFSEGIDFTFPAGTTIPAGGYLVIGANAAWLNTTYPGINALGDWSGNLANSGEMLRLDDQHGNLVNQVDYRFGGEWPELAAGNGSSLELANPNTDNTIGSAWRDSDESAKSTFQSFTINGGTYLRGTAGGIQDDEVRIWAVGDAHIILKNLVMRPTGGSGNLFVNGEVTTIDNNNVQGWQSRGTHAATFHDAEGVHLVADGHGDNKVNHLEKDAAGMSASTNYTLTFDARWVWGKPRLVAQTWDMSWGGIALVPIPNNLGTPGAANSRHEALPKAQITALRHSPAVPAQGQTVTITARVSSQTPLTSVQAIHRLDNINANGAWNTTTMVDNGTGGDAAANDGVYTAQIVPSSFGYFNNGSVVEFYVRTTASNGQTSTLPRAGATRPGLWVVATPGPTDLRRMRIVISAYWLNALDQNSATGGHTSKFNYKYPRLSAAYFPCTFIHNDGEVYYNSTVRKTGSPFTRQTDANLTRGRVVLPGDNPFRGKTKMYWDNDSGTSMFHNRITRYWLYLLGVPGNENEVCRVARNSGGYTVHETSEVFDKEMLSRIWEDGNEGQFYEVDDRFHIADDGATRLNNIDGDWGYKTGDSQGANNPTAYHNNFTPKSREWEYDYSSLIEWTRQLTLNPSNEQLERMADTQTMTAYAAVRGYIGDWDTLTVNRGKNAYMFNRPSDHKWTMLHWDSDLAFRDGDANLAVVGNRPGVGFYFTRPYIRRYLNHYLTEILNKYEATGPRMNAWLTAEENASTAFTANASVYQNWSNIRRSSIQSQIGTPLTANFAVSSPAAGSSTSANVVNLLGTAPSSAFSIVCLNQPDAVFSWDNELSWRLSGVWLREGANVLTLRMLDSLGNQVGTDLAFTLNKTGNAPPIAKMSASPQSQNVAIGQVLSVDASGSFDPEGAGPLEFVWTVTPSAGVNVTPLSPSTRAVVFTIPGTYTVSVQVTDPALQSATTNRTFSVYSAAEFDSFLGPALQGFTVTNAELRDNDSPDNWYSLNETAGHLVLQVTDTAPRPLTNISPSFPMITRALPQSDDFLLQTDIVMENRQFGTFLVGLFIETIEGGVPVKYAFGFENGTGFKVLRSFNGGAFSVQPAAAGTALYSGGPVTLRVHRQATSLLFQKLVNGEWITITTRAFSNPFIAGNGSLFLAAGSTGLPQTVRAAFDYFLLSTPTNSADLITNLRLTEIMYNPMGPNVEFIELKNIGTTPLDLTGAYFEATNPWSDQFTFPTIVLEPGQYVVVTNDIPGFQALYGTNILIAGQGVGALNNDGERLTLRDAAGNIVFNFTFSDTWYPASDGGGKSLEVTTTDPALYGLPSAWRESIATGGSPGSEASAPTITEHPASYTINPGQPFTLEVVATGTPAPTYQWRKDGEPITGATNASFSILAATEDHEGVYDVVVSNTGGNTVSNLAVITVNDPIIFDAHPVSQSANPGQAVNFSVAVSGTGPFGYQWRKGGQDIGGATASSLEVVAGPGTVGQYDVVVTNIVGSETSNPATLALNQPVVITAHPQNQTVNPGQTAIFSVTATGTAPFSYQWLKDGAILDGETDAELQIVAMEGDEGDYSVVVSNAVGPVPSNEATLSVNDPVIITQDPVGQTVNAGAPVAFTVTAEGTAPITYQWRLNGQDLTGETNATLEIAAASGADAGEYDVIVSNIVGPETSAVAILSVNAPAVIIEDPAPVVVGVGGSASFSVVANGTGPLSYQWFKGTAEIQGAISATYSIPSVTSADLGDYHVVITNVAGSTQSASASLSFVDWNVSAGNYQGLLGGGDPADPATNPVPGRVTVKVNKKGKFTGQLEYNGIKRTFKGSFDQSLAASTAAVKKNTRSVTLNIHLDAATNVIEVEAKEQGFGGEVVSAGVLPQIPVRPRTAPAPRMGRYTVLLHPGVGAPADLTAPGFLTVNVLKNGATTWVGKLPDGAKLKGSAWQNDENAIAFYAPLYIPKEPYAGHLAGLVSFDSTTVTGEMAWQKPAQQKGLYPQGFAALVEAEGSSYVAPARGARVIAPPELKLRLEGPITGDTFERMVELTTQNKFVFALPNGEKLKLTWKRATGAVVGKYYDSGVNVTRKLEGVVLQNENRAGGMFQGAIRSGWWELAAP